MEECDPQAVSVGGGLQIEMDMEWALTFDNIQLPVEAIYQLDLRRDL